MQLNGSHNGVLGFTSQNVTNFSYKDNWQIRWLAHMAV